MAYQNKIFENADKLVEEHNYYCLSRPVYVFLALAGVTNIALSLYFGIYSNKVDKIQSLIILNSLNGVVGMYEIYDLIKRSHKIKKLEGYFYLFFYYTAMILFNAYKGNDIFLNLLFIDTLEEKGFKILVFLSKAVLYITISTRIMALIYFVVYIITEWINIPKSLNEWKNKKSFLETVSAMFFMFQ